MTPWRNHRELWPAYREALALREEGDLLIVDDGSDPPLYFATARFEQSRGFQAACNHGLELATTDAVIFLNNDIEMIRPDWLQTLTGVLLDGVLVGAELRHDPHTIVDGETIPYLDGWCIGGMRRDLLAIGGWDETLEEPAYYGDNLLCLRARQHGMTLRAVNVGLRHISNVTSGDDIQRRDQASANNRRIYEQAVREALVAA